MQTLAPTLIDKLLDIAPGEPVTLQCATSTANIFLKKNAEPNRVKCVPEPVLLLEIPYVIQGKFMAIESGSDSGIDYVVTQARINEQTKLQHTPVGAITKVIQH